MYNENYFKTKGIGLSFLSPHQISYDQGYSSFEKQLSIFDLLANIDSSQLIRMLDSYNLKQIGLRPNEG